MAHWLTAMPVNSPRSEAASDVADVFDVHVADFIFEFVQESHRILPGDKGIAGIHIHAQVRAVHKSQHFFHELRFGGVDNHEVRYR